MIRSIYALRDVKAKVFLTPTVENNDETAIRNFAYAVNHTDGLYNFSPSDFVLYRLAEYDMDKGVITPVEPIECVCAGDALFRKESE